MQRAQRRKGQHYRPVVDGLRRRTSEPEGFWTSEQLAMCYHRSCPSFRRRRGCMKVSGTIQRNVEQAIQLCEKATTGQGMATIVRTLECDQRRLSMLHLEGLPNAVDIVCYEKEKIQSVTEEWMMSCGARRLHYNAPPRSCVLPDHEVCYPESSVNLAAAVT